MASVHDVAAYILHKKGPMTAMKLQKLVYYSQAWSLVWDEAPLFPERIEAWANGPVSPDLYEKHKGKFRLADGDIAGNLKALKKAQVETIDAVLRFYGDESAQSLSKQTHEEAPWRDARKGVPDGVRSNAEITHAAMDEFYGSLR